MDDLHLAPIKDVAMPDYSETVSRKLSDLEHRNLADTCHKETATMRL